MAALNQSEGMTGTQLNLSAAKRVLGGGRTEWQTGDTLVDLSSIEPLNLLMNLGTEMAKSPENPIVSSFRSTLDSFGAASAELPVLQSIGEFGKDVLVYGNDWKESALEQAGKTVVSSVTPNVLSALAKGLDDRPRNAYTGDGLWDIIQDSFKTRVPGLRETLPDSVNTMGEEKLYQGSRAGLLLNALLNPVGVNTYTQSEVSKEMQRVREATGDASFYPSTTIPKTLSSTKDGVTTEKTLDYEQRQDYQRDLGAALILVSTGMMGEARYQSAGAEQQSELLNDCRTYAAYVAKANALGMDTAAKWVQGTVKAQKETGLQPSTVIVYRDLLSRETERQGASAANQAVRNAILADSGLTVRQKNALDSIVITDGIYIPKDVDVDYTNGETFILSQMTESAQRRYNTLIKERFGMDADTYKQAWAIYQNDDLKADQKRAQLAALGYNGAALYKALGQKLE